MNDHHHAATPAVGGRPRTPVIGAVVLALVLILLPLGFGSASEAGTVHGSAGSAVDNLTVQATSTFSFVPNQVTVTPGALVHLTVTQEANFPHTFVLSSVANYTIPKSDTPAELFAFLNAHPPLVNLSLPGTPGVRAFANFTGPAAGTYEFVCEIPDHFQSGMYGFLVSTNQPAGSGSNGGIPVTLWIAGGVVVLIVGVAVVLVVARRRSTRSPPKGSSP